MVGICSSLRYDSGSFSCWFMLNSVFPGIIFDVLFRISVSLVVCKMQHIDGRIFGLKGICSLPKPRIPKSKPPSSSGNHGKSEPVNSVNFDLACLLIFTLFGLIARTLLGVLLGNMISQQMHALGYAMQISWW